MAKYINKYTNIEAYNADDGKQYPNVSYLIDQDIIKWEKNDPVHIVAVYNVTSTSEATNLLGSSTGITYQIIDDVRQDTVKDTYTFDTLGEHIVKYKLDGTSIAYGAFQHCLNLTSMEIPNSVTSIDSYAFNICKSLTSINIPDGVTSISNSTFGNCQSLTSINIPNGVTSIGYGALRDCSSLTIINIPDGVTSIANFAFYGNKGLTSITINAATPPTLGGTDAFTNTNNCPIYVPAESVDAYKTATNWSRYASRIQPIVA